MSHLRLESVGNVCLVAASLDQQEPLDGFLSSDELHRASRFRSPLHRRRYINGRGLLRMLLAEHVGIDPKKLDLVASEHGKPRLSTHPQAAFNMAHSENLAIYAFGSDGEEVGVDIEVIRSVDSLRLAKTCFSALEQTELEGFAPAVRLGAFFNGWVRKEAIVKADGRGMSLSLDSFSVGLGEPAELIVTPPRAIPAQWTLRSVPVARWARAAVATTVPDLE